MTPIFLVAGAPAVGKSTTAHALAAHFQKSIHIPVDDLREMVVSGIIRPGEHWGQELIEQLTAARASAVQMAFTYNQAGFVVVMDDFWDPNSRLLEYRPLFQEPDLHKILLFPSQLAAEERNRKRDGSEYIAGGIRTVYEHLKTDIPNLESQGWIVVDTTHKTIEETVQQIVKQTGANA